MYGQHLRAGNRSSRRLHHLPAPAAWASVGAPCPQQAPGAPGLQPLSAPSCCALLHCAAQVLGGKQIKCSWGRHPNTPPQGVQTSLMALAAAASVGPLGPGGLAPGALSGPGGMPSPHGLTMAPMGLPMAGAAAQSIIQGQVCPAGRWGCRGWVDDWESALQQRLVYGSTCGRVCGGFPFLHTAGHSTGGPQRTEGTRQLLPRTDTPLCLSFFLTAGCAGGHGAHPGAAGGRG